MAKQPTQVPHPAKQAWRSRKTPRTKLRQISTTYPSEYYPGAAPGSRHAQRASHPSRVDAQRQTWSMKAREERGAEPHVAFTLRGTPAVMARAPRRRPRPFFGQARVAQTRTAGRAHAAPASRGWPSGALRRRGAEWRARPVQRAAQPMAAATARPGGAHWRLRVSIRPPALRGRRSPRHGSCLGG